MENRKQVNSQSLKDKVFGMPNLPRCMQPTMYDIFTWGAQRTSPDAQLCNPNKLQTQPRQDCCHKQLQQSYQQPLSKDKPTIKIADQIKKESKNHRPNMISSNLYTYEKVCLKRSQSQQHINTQTKLKSQNAIQDSVKLKKTLDPQKDKKIIEDRQAIIKKFKTISRDLPNSSSVTYFGKPVFQCFGRGSSKLPNKSYNIMPHTGSNHPKTQQCYVSALLKAAKHKPQSHLPRKPIAADAELKKENKQGLRGQAKISVPMNVPLSKPDLINSIRFCNEAPKVQKVDVPRLSQTIIKNKKKERKVKQSKKKFKKSQSLAKTNDGLKYMNQRDNLLQLIEAKKINKSKLALKVTQCCPGNWISEEKYNNPSVQFLQDWDKMKPAGKQYPPREDLKDLIQFVK